MKILVEEWCPATSIAIFNANFNSRTFDNDVPTKDDWIYNPQHYYNYHCHTIMHVSTPPCLHFHLNNTSTNCLHHQGVLPIPPPTHFQVQIVRKQEDQWSAATLDHGLSLCNLQCHDLHLP
uniref:Uncharacterized protein n=1 Tax=Romanomermis culicivorax TaxID=13658 RepID=A0A915L316_ROMCU